MNDTPPKPKRRRWRWLVAGLLLVGISIWYFAAARVRHVATTQWVEEARRRSLEAFEGNQPLFSVPWKYRLVNKFFRRPVVVLFSHREEDFDILAKMRPCPVKIVIGFRTSAAAQRGQHLDALLAEAIKEQVSTGSAEMSAGSRRLTPSARREPLPE